MSGFAESSRDWYIEDNVLHATCQNSEGDWVESSLNLDDVLGNNDGTFEPGAGGFSGSATDVRIDTDAGWTILRASLQRADGEWNDTTIDLNSFIENNNGQLSA
ncbi:hypothetical protein EYR38_002295 [Pleurotus pulmonarius]|nr:hypothetical protein EYR38_002295 [Pleurotus pulmonarius]